MPTPNVDTARVLSLLGEAAEAAGSNLMNGLAAGMVGEGTEPIEFVPGDNAVAVAARMRGLDGTLVLALSADMAREVLSGPYGGQGIVGSVEPGLRAASAVLDQAAPRALRLDDFREVPANEMFGSADDSWFFGAAPLFRGEEHFASLAVFLIDPAIAAAAAASDDDDEGESYSLEVPEGSDAPLYTPPPVPAARGEAARFDPFTGGDALGGQHPLRLLHDVEMEVTVELGRTKMAVRNILALMPGSVIELDRAAGAPVDLLVNGTLIGRGEVVVIDEEFGVRIAEIIGRQED